MSWVRAADLNPHAPARKLDSLEPGWHVSFGDGVAYGVITHAVEVATAVLMGGPTLLKEGMSWREIKLRALHATPVKPLAPSPGGPLWPHAGGARARARRAAFLVAATAVGAER